MSNQYTTSKLNFSHESAHFITIDMTTIAVCVTYCLKQYENILYDHEDYLYVLISSYVPVMIEDEDVSNPKDLRQVGQEDNQAPGLLTLTKTFEKIDAHLLIALAYGKNCSNGRGWRI